MLGSTYTNLNINIILLIALAVLLLILFLKHTTSKKYPLWEEPIRKTGNFLMLCVVGGALIGITTQLEPDTTALTRRLGTVTIYLTVIWKAIVVTRGLIKHWRDNMSQHTKTNADSSFLLSFYQTSLITVIIISGISAVASQVAIESNLPGLIAAFGALVAIGLGSAAGVLTNRFIHTVAYDGLASERDIVEIGDWRGRLVKQTLNHVSIRLWPTGKLMHVPMDSAGNTPLTVLESFIELRKYDNVPPGCKAVTVDGQRGYYRINGSPFGEIEVLADKQMDANRTSSLLDAAIRIYEQMVAEMPHLFDQTYRPERLITAKIDRANKAGGAAQVLTFRIQAASWQTLAAAESYAQSVMGIRLMERFGNGTTAANTNVVTLIK